MNDAATSAATATGAGEQHSGLLRGRLRVWIPWAAAGLSGLLLATAFPPLEWIWLAWIGLVPLLLAVRGKPLRRAAALGFLAGAVFWLFNLAWLTRVTVAGWAALSLYCALYMVPPVVLAAWWRRDEDLGLTGWSVRCGWILLCAASWTGFEFLRGILFTGFPWNALGVSQYRQVLLLQNAEWGGAYALSFLLLWVNATLAAGIQGWRAGRTPLHRAPEIRVAVLLLVAYTGYGWHAYHQEQPEDQTFRVALIQPNVPQVEKWSPDHVDMIYERLERLSLAAAAVPDLDLLVWPETAVPDEVRKSPRAYQLASRIALQGAPLLVGSVDSIWDDDHGLQFHNSAILVDTRGAMAEIYDKQHLVMFGEYMPVERQFPFLRRFAPIAESFSPGREATLFPLSEAKEDFPFAVLICFEDVFPYLARRATLAGARWLVNQTNDAWFDESSGSRQHLAQGVFRSVENRVPTVRSANTGVTCMIDARGRIRHVLADESGRIQVEGFQMVSVPVSAVGRKTLFTRYGEWFGWSLALLALAAAARCARDVRQKRCS